MRKVDVVPTIIVSLFQSRSGQRKVDCVLVVQFVFECTSEYFTKGDALTKGTRSMLSRPSMERIRGHRCALSTEGAHQVLASFMVAYYLSCEV
jgi:hypothetical protein